MTVRVTLAMGALLLTAQPAGAESCVCTGPGWTALSAEDVSTVLAPETLEVPHSAPTEGDDAVSRPVDEIASMEIALPAPSAPERPVLWCDGDDDPRCDEGAPGTTSLELVPPPAGALGASDDLPLRGALTHLFVSQETHAAAGIRWRVERPPRG